MRPEEERREHERRCQRERDLQRRVHDHRDREVGLVPRRELDADDVLDRVARDGNDDEAGEVLAHVQRVDRGRERVHEPVADERRRASGEAQDERRRQAAPAGGCVLLARRAAQEARQREHEDREQDTRADEAQRLVV